MATSTLGFLGYTEYKQRVAELKSARIKVEVLCREALDVLVVYSRKDYDTRKSQFRNLNLTGNINSLFSPFDWRAWSEKLIIQQTFLNETVKLFNSITRDIDDYAPEAATELRDKYNLEISGFVLEQDEKTNTAIEKAKDRTVNAGEMGERVAKIVLIGVIATVVIVGLSNAAQISKLFTGKK